MIRRLFAAIAAIACLAAPVFAEGPTRFSVTVTGEAGKGDVILIPGLASSGAVWDQTVAQLSATHRVHVVQVAGFAGAPAGPNAAPGMFEPLVAELSDYAATLNKPAVIGHSIGGFAALHMALADPKSIGRVMVVDALPYYPLIFDSAATVETVAPRADAMRDQMLAMSPHTFNASQAPGLAIMVKSADALPRIREWSMLSDQAAVAHAMHAAMTTDIRPQLKDIKTPVTIVYAYDPAMGRTGASVTAMYIEAYSDLANAQLHRIDGGYHFIMLDQPELFAEAVTEFLQ